MYRRNTAALHTSVLALSLALAGSMIASGQTRTGTAPQVTSAENLRSAQDALRAAVAAYGSGDLDGARVAAANAVRLDARLAPAHELLGLVRLRQGDFAAGIHDLRSAAALDSRNSEFAYNLGVALLEHGRAAEAIPLLQQVRRAEPHSSDVLVNLARAYAATYRHQALSELIGQIPPDLYSDEQFLQTFSEVLGGSSEIAAATQLWTSAIAHNPDNELAYAAATELWLKRSKPQQAQALLETAPSHARGPIYYYALAQTDVALGRYSAAEALFERLTNQLPENARMWVGLIQARILANQPGPALTAAEEARRRFPDSAEFAYQVALVNYMLNRTPPALAALQEVLARTPNDDRALLLMGVLQARAGDYAQAVTFFQRLVNKNAHCQALASYFYGATLLRMHRLAEAEKELREALSCNPRLQIARVRLAQAVNEQGHPTEALHELETASAAAPDLPEVYYAMAQVRRKLGDNAGAAEALKRFASLQRGPETDDTLLRSRVP